MIQVHRADVFARPVFQSSMFDQERHSAKPFIWLDSAQRVVSCRA